MAFFLSFGILSPLQILQIHIVCCDCFTLNCLLPGIVLSFSPKYYLCVPIILEIHKGSEAKYHLFVTIQRGPYKVQKTQEINKYLFNMYWKIKFKFIHCNSSNLSPKCYKDK